jgi:hypothetical protein
MIDTLSCYINGDAVLVDGSTRTGSMSPMFGGKPATSTFKFKIFTITSGFFH